MVVHYSGLYSHQPLPSPQPPCQLGAYQFNCYVRWYPYHVYSWIFHQFLALTRVDGWLQEVCYNFAVEPPLLPLNGETIVPVSAIRNVEPRADVHATAFWGRRQGAFFDIRSPQTKNRYLQINLQTITMCKCRSNQEDTRVAENFVHVF